jgi:hypothetical protein
MKASSDFQKTIEKYLNKLASIDPLFAKTLAKENKNIDECITYILNTVKASGYNGFEDKEIFGMALHYYDEDDIKVGDKLNMQVVINHKIELSEEDIASAKQEAKERVIQKEMERLQKPRVVKMTTIPPVDEKEIAAAIKKEEQGSLF